MTFEQIEQLRAFRSLLENGTPIPESELREILALLIEDAIDRFYAAERD